jgi:hypothetical protein
VSAVWHKEYDDAVLTAQVNASCSVFKYVIGGDEVRVENLHPYFVVNG